jgi:dihydroxy-acid dehydratase
LEVEEEELALRREKWKQPPNQVEGAFLRRYAHLVTSANTGAVLRDF